METLKAHNGNGWNYGMEVAKEKIKLFRYQTNGHQNSNYEHKGWVKASPLDVVTEKELETLRMDSWGKEDMLHVKQAANNIEAAFHNGI